jgi:hypothetical protein
MSVDENFYSNLKSFDQFQGIFDAANYSELPLDWSVVITDIQGSTAAIQQGRYRQVNAIGVASIVAIINVVKPLAIPFIFGGDGASLCIPNRYLHEVKNALLATKMMATQQFSLSLRVGIVPCSDIEQSKYQILIGKLRVSEGYYQAAFTGEGLTYAENLVKNDQEDQYCFTYENSYPKADFTGFECRWKDVSSPHDETVSLLVKAITKTTDQNNAAYLELLEVIQKIYGDIESHRPVQKQYLELTAKARDLQDEVKIRAGSGSRLARWVYTWLLPWKVRLGRYWMGKGKQVLGTDWGNYKDTLVTNTDFRKFDDNLRMVISGSAVQRGNLEQYLKKQFQNGLLVYGIHVSDRALMTCVITDYSLHHIHFVDGSDGGYAVAAKDLKNKLKSPYLSGGNL